jgi:hypothetical protein
MILHEFVIAAMLTLVGDNGNGNGNQVRPPNLPYATYRGDEIVVMVDEGTGYYHAVVPLRSVCEAPLSPPLVINPVMRAPKPRNCRYYLPDGGVVSLPAPSKTIVVKPDPRPRPKFPI